MPLIASYDVYIFDCDGVILDSNQLKIDAMHNTLLPLVSDIEKVAVCVDYFRDNFGRSRFHHIDVFVNELLDLKESEKEPVKAAILQGYSSQCKALYLSADLTPKVLSFISSLQGHKYIASGSEQQELREVFKERGLDTHFDGVFGSPTKKSDLIKQILNKHDSASAVMFGDAISDYEGAELNNIDFVAYLPFSNVKEKMLERCHNNRSISIDSWEELNGK
ncbi:HAD family hydrolase [uncultured Psychromonas sp.]|uniref:HAD family hydrolase n=1 Tax=uncultured Psychromonas sp. TaxID=173974 RepID=UPI002625445D|nr:HAD family hydrolase [uncultured Psychromonas sp.]